MASYIHSIAYHLPEKKLTNYELSNVFSSWNEEKISTKIGVLERRVTGENEFVSDLAEIAALNLFENSEIAPHSIDFLILCTQSPDYLLPTTACILQERLKLPTSCGAFDFNLGCSGFIYGLALAKSLVDGCMAENVLLITADTYTKYIHPMDKSVRPIFGDGAAAILIKNDSTESRIGRFVFGTDGKGADSLIVPAGGLRMPRNPETGAVIKDRFGNERSLDNLHMNGPEVFNYFINLIPCLIEDILFKNELKFDEVDFFVFHQASRSMLENLKIKLCIPEDKFYMNMTRVGNTVSASIPIALKLAENEARIKKGDTILIAGFGVGYSWGGTVVKF